MFLILKSSKNCPILGSFHAPKFRGEEQGLNKSRLQKQSFSSPPGQGSMRSWDFYRFRDEDSTCSTN
jgi:hypothetical protein